MKRYLSPWQQKDPLSYQYQGAILRMRAWKFSVMQIYQVTRVLLQPTLKPKSLTVVILNSYFLNFKFISHVISQNSSHWVRICCFCVILESVEHFHLVLFCHPLYHQMGWSEGRERSFQCKTSSCPLKTPDLSKMPRVKCTTLARFLCLSQSEAFAIHWFHSTMLKFIVQYSEATFL